jgi:hypothetical protein
MMEHELPGIRFSVSPEPTEEEMAAIAAVVAAGVAKIAASGATSVPVRSRDGDRWQRAAREEALRASSWHVDTVGRWE